MKVRQDILDLVNNVSSRMRIATKLGTGEPNVAVHMRKNLPNGRLTKMDALKAISEETGTDLNEILEETEAKQVSA